MPFSPNTFAKGIYTDALTICYGKGKSILYDYIVKPQGLQATIRVAVLTYLNGNLAILELLDRYPQKSNPFLLRPSNFLLS